MTSSIASRDALSVSGVSSITDAMTKLTVAEAISPRSLTIVYSNEAGPA